MVKCKVDGLVCGYRIMMTCEDVGGSAYGAAVGPGNQIAAGWLWLG